MDKMVAFCGIVCTDCDAFIATQENNDAKRREMAESASKQLGRKVKPEEINCAACLNTGGRHIGYCNVCEIRKCGMEKEVENCAYCIDYECEKLAKFLEQAPKAKKTLEKIRQQKIEQK
ncbi:MAG: DUF3795 domain-containing protein [Candidatus Bathyarchaeia archaeon]